MIEETGLYDQEESEEEEDVGPSTSSVSYVCEDCDYRWDTSIENLDIETVYDPDRSREYCPMCGSFNSMQI